MPQKSWAVGEEVLAADFNAYLQNQVVAVFTTTSQRDTDWASPPNGAKCIVTATNTEYQRIGGAWYTPYQRLAYAQTTANQGPTSGSAENVLSLLVLPTVSLPTTRLVRVEMGFRAAVGAAGQSATVRIREGATTAGTQITDLVIAFAPSGVEAGNGGGRMFGRTYTATGSKQWCVTLQGASNPAELVGTTTSPLWIEARDVGPG